MHVVHVVPRIDEEASGLSNSVPRLCQSMADHASAVELLCLAGRDGYPGFEMTVCAEWRAFGRFAMSPELAMALRERSRRVDIVHTNSLWTMPTVAAGWLVPGNRARLVVSPRGTLAPWALAYSRRKKRLMWPLQRRTLFAADLLHATSESELADIRAMGLRQPVALVPNGVHVPTAVDRGSSASGRRTLLFLSRIHPKKGLDLLLTAWRELQDRHPEWRLQVAGRGEAAHVASVEQLVRRLSIERVEFLGPIYGEQKSAVYAGADLFVLPTHSENFGIVVAEALAHGVPAVVSTGAPWAGVATHDCGWWIENNVAALTSTLDEAMGLCPDLLRANGERGRNWMRSEFSWPTIGRSMVAAYRWLLDGGERPPCVMLA